MSNTRIRGSGRASSTSLTRICGRRATGCALHLFQFIRERARQRWTSDQAGASRVVAYGAMLDPTALTIGFARRFTGYKRPDLVFRDLDRLVRLVSDIDRPVQFVFAGKAHPADEAGKHHLQHIFRQALDARMAGRIAFVDDYDLHVAHLLVQGCDVWLNTPRKPLEASGTSGMKASMNGTLHLSIGDGWWAEGHTFLNGWVIEGKPASTDLDAVDAADADALYALLETGRRARLLRARRARPAAALARDGQAGDPHRDPAVLEPSDAQGLRGERVPAGV